MSRPSLVRITGRAIGDAEALGAKDVSTGDPDEVGVEDVGVEDTGVEDVGVEDVGAADTRVEDVGTEETPSWAEVTLRAVAAGLPGCVLACGEDAVA